MGSSSPNGYDQLGNDHGPELSEDVHHGFDLHPHISGQSTSILVLKWLVPGFIFMLCFLLQSMGLHAGTHYYVQWMIRLESNLNQKTTEMTASGETLSASVAEGSLHDLTAEVFGYHEVPMATLDFISACIPMIWMILVLWKQDIVIWSKCCLCGSLLALGKGFLCFATVVPDSTGWARCKERLGPDGVAYFKDPDTLNFGKSLVEAFLDLLYLEVVGVVQDGHNRHLRYCADMVYSGHTYFCCLFAVGLYDLVRKLTRLSEHRSLMRFVVGSLLLAAVLADVILILLNRFHYTMDICIAIWGVLLLYTNGCVAIAVTWWIEDCFAESPKPQCAACQRQHFHDHHDGDFMVPPCFVPFCCLDGRYFIRHHPSPLDQDMDDSDDASESAREMQHMSDPYV